MTASIRNAHSVARKRNRRQNATSGLTVKIPFGRDLIRLRTTIQRCENHSFSVTIRLNAMECAIHTMTCACVCLIGTRMMTDLRHVTHF